MGLGSAHCSAYAQLQKAIPVPTSLRTHLAQWFYTLQWRVAPHEIETRFLSRALPRGAIDTFVDVGANIGMYTHVMRPKSARIVAFEPNPALFARTRHFYATPLCTVEPAGVHSETGTATLRVPAKDGIESVDLGTIASDNDFGTSEHDTIHNIDIKTVALDDYFAAHKNRIDMIKVDVEGNEFNVVNGSQDIIQRDHPVWLIETELRHSAHVSELFNCLELAGYRACYVGRNNKLGDVTAEDLSELQSPENLAIRSRNPLSRVYVNNIFFVHPKSTLAPYLT